MNNHLITSGKIHRLLGAWIAIFMLLWAGNAAAQIYIGNARVIVSPATTPAYYTYSENETGSILTPIPAPGVGNYVMICKSSVGDTLKVTLKDITITIGKTKSSSYDFTNLYFYYEGPVVLQFEAQTLFLKT